MHYVPRNTAVSLLKFSFLIYFKISKAVSCAWQGSKKWLWATYHNITNCFHPRALFPPFLHYRYHLYRLLLMAQILNWCERAKLLLPDAKSQELYQFTATVNNYHGYFHVTFLLVGSIFRNLRSLTANRHLLRAQITLFAQDFYSRTFALKSLRAQGYLTRTRISTSARMADLGDPHRKGR